MKERLRAITRRNPPRRVARIIAELNSFLTGWVLYFRLADCKTRLQGIDEWIRHKLRCYRLKQLKRRGAIIRYLNARGVSRPHAIMTASSGKGWWRLSQTPAVQQAMSIARLTTAGLVNLTE
jgi:RNA-directed DNA polymerase